jgi:hypothetical protein
MNNNNNTTPSHANIAKAIVKMPLLLSRTLLAMPQDQRDNFIALFMAEQAKVNEISQRLGIKIVQPNFTRDTERLVAGLSKRKTTQG